MQVKITKESTATFKCEDSDKDGMPIGPVVIFRDRAARAAADRGRAWVDGGWEPRPEGVYDVGWDRLDSARAQLARHGVELEEL